jgi:hypothetical protein
MPNKIEVTNDLERNAFRSFAEIYPHEAAECNWPEFVAMVRSKKPGIPEEAIRRLLRRPVARFPAPT